MTHPTTPRQSLQFPLLRNSGRAMRVTLLAVFCFAMTVAGCSRKRVEVYGYETTDAVINKAYDDARSSVQEFISKIASPQPGYRYLVKVRIEADGHVEHVWLEPVGYQNRLFRGSIANTPAKITSIKKDDVVQAKPEEISDWVILDDSGTVTAGGFTQKAMERHPGAKP